MAWHAPSSRTSRSRTSATPGEEGGQAGREGGSRVTSVSILIFLLLHLHVHLAHVSQTITHYYISCYAIIEMAIGPAPQAAMKNSEVELISIICQSNRMDILCMGV